MRRINYCVCGARFSLNDDAVLFARFAHCNILAEVESNWLVVFNYRLDTGMIASPISSRQSLISGCFLPMDTCKPLLSFTALSASVATFFPIVCVENAVRAARTGHISV
jgi:hypothetical protein